MSVYLILAAYAIVSLSIALPTGQMLKDYGVDNRQCDCWMIAIIVAWPLLLIAAGWALICNPSFRDAYVQIWRNRHE